MLEKLELARLAPPAAVLDLACGPGEPALTLARRLTGRARVTGVDLSPEMVRIAAERAAAEGAPNLEFREADAQRLPFAQGSFDLVTCRFGLMLVAEPPAVAREVGRVLRKGGRFGFTVWSENAREAPMATLRQVIGNLVPEELVPPAPDMYALGTPHALNALMEGAGLSVLEIEARSSDWRFDHPRHYWEAMTRGSPVGVLLAQLPAELQGRIEAETLRRLSTHARSDGSLALATEALIAVARA